MKWNFLYQNTAASRTPDWGATAPRPCSLCPQLNLLNSPPTKIPAYASGASRMQYANCSWDVAMLGKRLRCSGLLTKLHSLLRSCCCRHWPRHACYVNITATRLLHCVTAGNFLTSAINIKIPKADLVPWSQLIRTALGNQRRISLFRTPTSYLGGPRGRLSSTIQWYLG